MAKTVSPPPFNSDHYYDPNFTAEISAKMQVPKRIKISGDMDDDEEFAPKPWLPEKIDMRVPDRILVAGTCINDRDIFTCRKYGRVIKRFHPPPSPQDKTDTSELQPRLASS